MSKVLCILMLYAGIGMLCCVLDEEFDFFSLVDDLEDWLKMKAAMSKRKGVSK